MTETIAKRLIPLSWTTPRAWELFSCPFFSVASMRRFRHLIFDLDGTLVNTEADLAAAANWMLEHLDLAPLSLEQVGGYIGNGALVLVERVLGPENIHQVGHGFEIFMQYYADHLVDRSVVYPGIDQVLVAAQAQGMFLSVLTNKPETPSRRILSALGLLPFFGGLVGGDTLATKKPSPHGIEYLQRLTRVPLVETLLIGDSSIDMETGHCAGISICGVAWGFGSQRLADYSPEFIVDSADELLEAILS